VCVVESEGWPKFANNIVLESTKDDGVVIALIAPVVAKLPKATVTVVTDYPFADDVTITVDLTAETLGATAAPRENMPVHIRIPGWAHKATVDGAPAKNGTLHATSANAGAKTTFKVDFAPEVRVEIGWGSHGETFADADSVEDDYANYVGALDAGGDIHSGNMSYADAVAYCNKTAACAGFTRKGTATVARTAAVLPTFFKTTITRNSDPSWQAFVKASGPSTKPTNAATVLRGALVYSLQLVEDFSVQKTWEPFLNKDYDITTTSTWNYALQLDEQDPSSTLKFSKVGEVGAIPFNISGYPSVIHAQVKQLPGWTEALQAAKEPPASPIDCSTTPGGCGETKTVLLVPHGATDLRIAGLPWSRAAAAVAAT
jgi:hypothetical protein